MQKTVERCFYTYHFDSHDPDHVRLLLAIDVAPDPRRHPFLGADGRDSDATPANKVVAVVVVIVVVVAAGLVDNNIRRRRRRRIRIRRQGSSTGQRPPFSRASSTTWK
jgi:hypothetical protein